MEVARTAWDPGPLLRWNRRQLSLIGSKCRAGAEGGSTSLDLGSAITEDEAASFNYAQGLLSLIVRHKVRETHPSSDLKSFNR